MKTLLAALALMIALPAHAEEERLSEASCAALLGLSLEAYAAALGATSLRLSLALEQADDLDAADRWRALLDEAGDIRIEPETIQGVLDVHTRLCE